MLRICLLICALISPAGAETRALMEESFTVAQEGQASAAGAALRQIGQRAALGDDALAVVLRERQALAGRKQAVEAALAEEGADRTELGGQVDQMALELRVMDARNGLADQAPCDHHAAFGRGAGRGAADDAARGRFAGLCRVWRSGVFKVANWATFR